MSVALLKEGDRYGHLTAVRFVRRANNRVYWLFSCDCSGEITTRVDQVKESKNPGCRACLAERKSQTQRRHGAATYGVATRLYGIWQKMRYRCRPKENPSLDDITHHNYAGKGIRVCDEWQEFIAFRDWALANGYEDHLTIERMDSNDHYRPGNCEWITRNENTRRAMAKRVIKKLPKGYMITLTGMAPRVKIAA